jgi:hypothetical protein
MRRWFVATSFTFKNVLVALWAHLMEVMGAGSCCHPLSTWGKDALKLFERMRGKNTEDRIA